MPLNASCSELADQHCAHVGMRRDDMRYQFDGKGFGSPVLTLADLDVEDGDIVDAFPDQKCD